jgi:hypothetical protein
MSGRILGVMMKLYKHDDYQAYYDAQIDKNKKKLHLVWVKRAELRMLSNHIKKHIPKANFGICHGVRNAEEVKVLRKLLGIEVIGTEISPTAEKFKNTIMWDFHKVKDEWLDNVDFIYSNSFDHSYDPKFCLSQWMSCIKKNGVCYIHWNHENSKPERVSAADCFMANKEEYKNMFNAKYKVIDEFHLKKSPSRIIFAVKHRG